MALEFQFAFLGPEHNYVASLTKTSSNGIPRDKSAAVEFYGLPKPFCDQYRARLALQRYLYNIRGHDFLSYVGQWKSPAGDGPLDASTTLYEEIKELSTLATEEEKLLARTGRKANLIASFGPSPGSFFVDAFRQKRYRWQNLPADLEDEIQKIVCENGWVKEGKGKIWDVAINARGGWVLQLDEGADWRFGGELHPTLENALQEYRGRKGSSIERLFLNHQHPTEYVLLFSDGTLFVRLHKEFEYPLRRLTFRWHEIRAKKDKRMGIFEWFNFSPSCGCGQDGQRYRDAAYYARRGLFHLARGNDRLAHKYLREANEQHPDNFAIQESYVRTLKTLRAIRYDPRLEEHLFNANQLTRQDTGLSGTFHQEDSEMKDFRNEYVWAMAMLRRGKRTEQLAYVLEGPREAIPKRPAIESKSAWSYTMGTTVDVFSMGELGDVEVRSDPAVNFPPGRTELP